MKTEKAVKFLQEQKAVKFLQEQIDLIDSVKSKGSSSQSFQEWKSYTAIVIENIFGNNTRHLKDFNEISYISYSSAFRTSTSPPDYKRQEEAFMKGLETAKSMLTSMKEELIQFPGENEDEEKIVGDNPLVKMEKICNRFHLIANQIRKRHDNRSTIIIEDEYDVQDLLHAILRLEFDDIRPEEWTPSYAGKSARVDFLLKKEEIIIEVKKTRKGLSEKEVGDQLLIDIQRYQKHPDCKYLVCFIYDPEEKIPNPQGIENDLSKTKNGIKIITIITPKGL
jgi:hypothetical protein